MNMRRQRKTERRTAESDRLCLYFVLVFIRGKIKELLVEAARDRPKSIGPFLRGAKVFHELEDKLRDDDLAVLDSLKSIGMGTLPFSISEKDFRTIPISEWISAGGRFYKRVGAFGSIRPLSDTRDVHGMQFVPSKGLLVAANVYVRFSIHHVACRIRFRYAGAERTVGAYPSNVPVRLDSGEFFRRNSVAEAHVLSGLHKLGIEIDERGQFDLSAKDFESLVKTPPEGISFFSERTTASTSDHSFSETSGIKWFGEQTDLDSADFLDAYLEDRNYVRLNGIIGLFNRTAIAKHVEKAFVNDASAQEPVRRLVSSVILLREHNIGGTHPRSSNPRLYLKDWQVDGVNWLHDMKSNGVGAILADEMGLGKTIQTIAFLAEDNSRHKGFLPTLIVCPASVVQNWKNEFARFEPHLASHVTDGFDRFSSEKGEILVLSYERAVRNIEMLKKLSFENIVLDEAQKVKNSETISYRTLFSLRSSFRMMLTGTPIENTITELWNHVEFVNPSTRGAMFDIRRRYPTLENPQKFAKFSLGFLSSFVLARQKRDVGIELPPLTERIVECKMDCRQRLLYDRVRRKFLSGLKSGSSARISSLALEALLRLRQCCCLPSMLPATLASDIDVPSCKIDRAFQFLLTAISEKKKTLVFSQFLEVLDVLRTKAEDIGIRCYVLTGTTKDRQQLVDEFNASDIPSVFLISLKAGGVGMNLASASRVVLFDPWWNPAVESQAFARAHRMGQTDSVDVFKLVCENSVETKMLALEETKQKLAANLKNATLSKEELVSLLK